MSEEIKVDKPVPRKKKSRAARGLKQVNLDKVEKGLKTILAREVNHLLDLSHAKKLDKDAAVSLIGYIRAMKDLKKQELEELENMSDEELKAVAEASPSTDKGQDDDDDATTTDSEEPADHGNL